MLPGGISGVSKAVVSPDGIDIDAVLLEVHVLACFSSGLSLVFFILLNSLDLFLRQHTIAPY